MNQRRLSERLEGERFFEIDSSRFVARPSSISPKLSRRPSPENLHQSLYNDKDYYSARRAHSASKIQRERDEIVGSSSFHATNRFLRASPSNRPSPVQRFGEGEGYHEKLHYYGEAWRARKEKNLEKYREEREKQEEEEIKLNCTHVPNLSLSKAGNSRLSPSRPQDTFNSMYEHKFVREKMNKKLSERVDEDFQKLHTHSPVMISNRSVKLAEKKRIERIQRMKTSSPSFSRSLNKTSSPRRDNKKVSGASASASEAASPIADDSEDGNDNGNALGMHLDISMQSSVVGMSFNNGDNGDNNDNVISSNNVGDEINLCDFYMNDEGNNSRVLSQEQKLTQEAPDSSKEEKDCVEKKEEDREENDELQEEGGMNNSFFNAIAGPQSKLEQTYSQHFSYSVNPFDTPPVSPSLSPFGFPMHEMVSMPPLPSPPQIASSEGDTKQPSSNAIKSIIKTERSNVVKLSVSTPPPCLIIVVIIIIKIASPR